MTINFKKMKTIDELIARENTGRPKQLSQKIGVSPATLYRYLNAMRKAGAPIKYSRIRETYSYEEYGRLSLVFCNKKPECGLFNKKVKKS